MTTEGGVKYLASKQLKQGGFVSYRLRGPEMTRTTKYRTTFVPSLIALALTEVHGTSTIRHKVARFLREQKSAGWSWNYWDHASTLSRTQPYPDDLDDTFLALAALWHDDQNLFTPEVMADIAHLLFATETKPGGPYTTWLVAETADGAWKDVDLIVNINIAGFLSLQEVELPRLNRLIETAIAKKQLTSPYYPSLQPAVYFLSRWYRGHSVGKLREMLLERQVLGAWETPHQTAMAITSLLHFGHPPEQLDAAIQYLKDTQAKDGSWPAGPICIGAPEQEQEGPNLDGSPSLTTALCLEAMTLYERMLKQVPAKVVHDSNYSAVTRQVKATITRFDQPDLRAHTVTMLDSIIKKDKDKQIVLLPWIVARAAGVKVDATTLSRLAMANLWGWMAYRIYDDFLDNEGDPKWLPTAITANRNLVMTLAATLPGNQAFQKEVATIMDELDGANAWEVSHCRGTITGSILKISALPDYGDLSQLADRSLGHAIAGLGVLYAAELDVTSPKFANLRDFFRHYIIARQLNDDAHDWEEDLGRCHVNAMAAVILKQWLADTDRRLDGGIDLKKDIESLRSTMWQTAIDDVCAKIMFHVDAARQALEGSEAHWQTDQLFRLLDPPEKAAKKALQTRDQALKFISSI